MRSSSLSPSLRGRSPQFITRCSRSDDAEMQQALAREFVVGGHKAYWVARLGRLYDVHLVSALDPEFVRRCHLYPVPPAAHAAALEALLRQAGPAARVAVMPYSGVTFPVHRQPAEAASIS